jgi:glycosyltransferase involved in cell wall biosynthesis
MDDDRTRSSTAASGRGARVLALAEGPIPSAVLGVHAVFAHLAHDPGLCELRTGSSVDPEPADLAWADSVVLVRGASPGERRLLIEARRLGRLVATYMDDDLERVPAEARSGYFFTSAEVRRNVAAIVAGADLTLVCSERLGTELERRHGRPTTLCRQPRPPLREELDGAEPSLERDRAGEGERRAQPGKAPLRIGFLGSVDHAAFLDALLEAPLRRLHVELGERLQLVFCGAEPAFARRLGATCEPFASDFAAWRRRAFSLRLDVGLAPMPDTPFHRLKYWNKYLEYASLGVPAIYSNVPPNADVVRDGDTGLVVENRAEAWETALRRLIGDGALRAALAARALTDAEDRFAPRALEADWRQALAPLLRYRAPAVAARDVRLQRGRLRFALDRFAVYGPLRFAGRALGRLTGRLRPG